MIQGMLNIFYIWTEKLAEGGSTPPPLRHVQQKADFLYALPNVADARLVLNNQHHHSYANSGTQQNNSQKRYFPLSSPPAHKI